MQLQTTILCEISLRKINSASFLSQRHRDTENMNGKGDSSGKQDSKEHEGDRRRLTGVNMVKVRDIFE